MSLPIDDALRLELDALLDGALSEEQAAALRARIDGDADLAAEYERRRRMVELVRGLPSEAAPAGLAEAVLAGLPGSPDVSTGSAPGRAGGGILRAIGIWGAGLAAAAALVLAVSLGRDDPASSDDWTLAKQDADDRPADESGRFVAGADQLGGETRFLEGADARRDAAMSVEKLKNQSLEAGVPREEQESPLPGSTAPTAAAKDSDATDGARETREVEAKAEVMRDRGAPKGGAEPSMLALVEQRTTALTPDERARYLGQVARVSEAALRTHVERVAGQRVAATGAPKAPGTPREPGKTVTLGAAEADAEQADGGVAFDVAVDRRSEAETLRKLLMRAFPPQRESSKKLPETTEAKVARNEQRGATPGELSLAWTVSAPDAAALAIWLRRIGLRNRPEVVAGTAAPIVRDAEPVAVRVRIRYGPQAQVPERAKGEDK